MNKRRLTAIIMSVFMILSMIPNLVFAEMTTEMLGGKLKVAGIVMTGTELRGDYSMVTPAGITDDDVTFEWTRNDAQDPGQVPTVLGTERTYTPNDGDLGYTLTLKITGIPERGLSGELVVTTNPVAATAEEAAAYPQDDDDFQVYIDNGDQGQTDDGTVWTDNGEQNWTDNGEE
ncbi:MAG: hypothetical protein Q4B26_13420, partial [Eubacteriales bacterium]|nr:hypothetical protein [Eubacteriales bacterium]